MAKQKSYNYKIDEDIFFAIKNRATLETQVSGKQVAFIDILNRAILKEVKSFKPLIQKKGNG